MLANFLDLVIWGHEHECLITPTPGSVGDYFITQPGTVTLCYSHARLFYVIDI